MIHSVADVCVARIGQCCVAFVNASIPSFVPVCCSSETRPSVCSACVVSGSHSNVGC